MTEYLREPLRREILRLLGERDRLDQRINDLALGGVLQLKMDPVRIESIDTTTGDVSLKPPEGKT